MKMIFCVILHINLCHDSSCRYYGSTQVHCQQAFFQSRKSTHNQFLSFLDEL